MFYFLFTRLKILSNKMSFLEIKNLNVNVDGKEILKGLNLNLEKGKVYALMGPNGSGKSTLSQVLAGNPKYKISGEISFEGEEISNLKPHERAKKGLFLSFQYPVEISGVTISSFLKTALNSLKGKKISPIEFWNILEKQSKKLNIDKSFLSRFLNEGFSGGEKKKAEILQMLILNPKLAILDETDSGLDIDSLKIVSQGINNFMDKDKTILIITHYQKILDYVKPDKILVMKNGNIVKEGGKELIEELEKWGYEGIK